MKTLSDKIQFLQVSIVSPRGSLVGFGSLHYDKLFLGSIALHRRADNPEKIRLVFPSKKIGLNNLNIFYPTDPELLEELTSAFQEEVDRIGFLKEL